MTIGRLAVAILICVAGIVPVGAASIFLDFEGRASTGGLINVNPQAPYVESGFRFSTTNGQSAVFDSAASADMPGNLTDWFGFEELNTVTLAPIDSMKTFNLGSLLAGPSSIGTGSSASLVVTGTAADGGTLFAAFTLQSAAAPVTLNWMQLVSVRFNSTDDVGIDNVALELIPEPSACALSLIALGLSASFARVRRARRAPSVE